MRNNIQTTHFISDFEKAISNAVRECFERNDNDIKISGCFFHFKQSIKRKIEDLGLKRRYSKLICCSLIRSEYVLTFTLISYLPLTKSGTDAEFQDNVNMIGALAFLPPTEIPTAYFELKEHIRDGQSDTENQATDEFLQYFEENYVIGKNGRRPQFPPSFWSVSSRTGMICQPRKTRGK